MANIGAAICVAATLASLPGRLGARAIPWTRWATGALIGVLAVCLVGWLTLGERPARERADRARMRSLTAALRTALPTVPPQTELVLVILDDTFRLRIDRLIAAVSPEREVTGRLFRQLEKAEHYMEDTPGAKVLFVWSDGMLDRASLVRSPR